MRYAAAKADANQPEIVKALRRHGASVLHLHTVGHGCPDLAVGVAGSTYLLEIKDGSGKLTAQEEEFFKLWKGHVAIVRTPAEAVAAVGLTWEDQ